MNLGCDCYNNFDIPYYQSMPDSIIAVHNHNIYHSYNILTAVIINEETSIDTDTCQYGPR